MRKSLNKGRIPKIHSQKSDNKKIVITGGTGFIGSHLLKRLSKGNFRIVVLTRSTNRKRDTKNIRFIKCDISKSDISKFIKNADYIFHLAATKPQDADITIPEYLDNIKISTKIALANRNAKIIFASTNNVYGIPTRIPIREEDEAKPRELYGLSKLLSEITLDFFSRKRGWPLVILRIANVYGPESKRKGGVLLNFFTRLRENKPLEIYGDGLQKRDRVWITDVVNALVLAMKTKTNGIFNIGSGKGSSTIEVAQIMAKLLNKKPRFIFKRSKKTKNIVLDITKARRVLTYRPKITFEKGLKLLLQQWLLKT